MKSVTWYIYKSKSVLTLCSCDIENMSTITLRTWYNYIVLQKMSASGSLVPIVTEIGRDERLCSMTKVLEKKLLGPFIPSCLGQAGVIAIVTLHIKQFGPSWEQDMMLVMGLDQGPDWKVESSP